MERSQLKLVPTTGQKCKAEPNTDAPSTMKSSKYSGKFQAMDENRNHLMIKTSSNENSNLSYSDSFCLLTENENEASEDDAVFVTFPPMR